MSIDSRLPKFRSLAPAERLQHLQALLDLPADDVALLRDPGALALERADGMIENVIGTFELPYAVASNFQINGRDVIVPMVVEEPSVVAAASFMAKLAREAGGFQTSSSLPLMRAQVQIVDVADPFNARLSLLRRKDEIIELANRKDQLLNSLGGGCRDIEVHTFAQSPRGPMLVAHLIVDGRDAMGANTVNTMAEAVVHFINDIGPDNIFEGDVYVTNDPWKGTGHLHDITIVSPSFYKGRLIGYFASTAHVVDIGGRGFGPDAREVYE